MTNQLACERESIVCIWIATSAIAAATSGTKKWPPAPRRQPDALLTRQARLLLTRLTRPDPT